MSHTLTRGVAAAARPSRVGGAARTYWNPYAVGFLLGLVLLATYMVAGRGLGATAAFAAVAAWLTGLVSPEQVQANAVHVRYWNEGAPLQSWTLFLLVGAAIGAFVSGWQGRRLAWTVERGPNVSDNTRLWLASAPRSPRVAPAGRR